MNTLILMLTALLGQALPQADATPVEDDFVIEEVAAPVKVEALPQPVAWVTRGFALPNACIAPAGIFQLHIDHRANQAVNADPYWYQNVGKDFFGLDKGFFKIGIGLSYSFTNWLDASFTRVNGTWETFDTYETLFRVRLLDESKFGVNLVAGGGFDWFQQDAAKDAIGGLATLALDTREVLGLQGGGILLMAFDSSGPDKANTSTSHSMAVGGHLRYNFTHAIAVQFEGAGTAFGYAEPHPYLALGMTFRTLSHVFSVLLTNTQYLTVDALAAGAYMPTDKPLLGFTIVREWDFR